MSRKKKRFYQKAKKSGKVRDCLGINFRKAKSRRNQHAVELITPILTC